ncbi:MAG: MFS transporter [Candidatus Solibacter sp.]
MGSPQTQIAGAPALPLVPELGQSRIPHTFRALRHRNFRLFISGQIISLVGTWMQNVALSWLVYRLTHSELLLGTCWFCSQIAVFALGPLGGIVVDRFPRRTVVIVTQILSMLQAFLLTALVWSGRVQVWHLLALAGVLGVINAFDMPGRQALVIQMTSQDDLINAISLNSAVFNTARVVGPAIAGVLLSFVSEATCFLINGISFIAVILCLLAMRLPPVEPHQHAPPLQHLADGFRYAAGHRAVRRVLALMGAATLAGMPAFVLMPFFADDIFHRGSSGLGILMGAMGIGAVIGTLTLARRTVLSGLGRVMAINGFLTGVCYLAFAWSPYFYFTLAIMPVIGYSVMRQMASANTTIQTQIPDHYRGRIMAFYSMTVVGLGPFGSLAAGALAARFGARPAMAAGGVLALAAAARFAWQLRRDPIAA